MAAIGEFDSLNCSVSSLPRAPKTSSTRTERSVKSRAGKRVRRGSAPALKRAPHVRIRWAIVMSAKRERGPTKQHRFRIQPASVRETTKIRFAFASGITRHEDPIAPERACWTQKWSTNGARSLDGEKSCDWLAAAPDWSRRIMNGRSDGMLSRTRQMILRQVGRAGRREEALADCNSERETTAAGLKSTALHLNLRQIRRRDPPSRAAGRRRRDGQTQR